MLPLFTTAWALAILFHLATPQGSRWSPASALLAAAAAAALFWPAASLSLVALTVSQVAQFWGRLPRAQTSEYFKFLCGLCLLATWVSLAWDGATWQVDEEAWYRSFAPLLRLATSLMMGAAVLHKLNRDFLATDASDAPQFFDPVLTALGLPRPRWIGASTPYVTLLIEGSIAVGLLFPATRLLALWVLLAFFLPIGLQGIVQFSTLACAAALLFFDERVLAGAWASLSEPPRHAVFALACCLFFAAAVIFRAIRFRLLIPGATLLLLGVAFALGKAAATASFRAAVQEPTFPLSIAQLALVLVFVVNELGPYVGYKDWPVFSMYSNLRTGYAANHLFLGWLFVPFFKRRAEVAMTSDTKGLLYENAGQAGVEYYVPRGSFVAIARHERRHPLLYAGDRRQPIAYACEGTAVTEDLESLCRKRGSWLDLLLPPRFFYHFPAARPGREAGRDPGPVV